MKSELVVTKNHSTYLKDAVVLAVIGFAAALIYFGIRMFLRFDALIYVYLFFVSSWVWVIKQKFLPERYVFVKENQQTSIWRRGDFVEKIPDEKEVIDVEMIGNIVQVNYKNFGMSQLKNSVQFKMEDYGKDAIAAIYQFLGKHEEFDPLAVKANVGPDTKVSAFKSENFSFARLTFKPSKLPVTFAAYLVMIGSIVLFTYFI